MLKIETLLLLLLLLKMNEWGELFLTLGQQQLW
jgi:hypothetical protein